MDSEKLFKESYKCFNIKNGYCSASFEDPHLSDICFYCLKNIKGFTPPENIKAKFINKKRESDINLKEPFKEPFKEGKSQSKEIEIPDYNIKKFKYPYLLTSYPFLKDKYKFLIRYKGAETLLTLLNLNQVFSMYGGYKIFSYRDPKLMDIKVSLADIYLSDFFKARRYEISVKDFLKLLKLESTGYYRNEILESQHYLKNTTFITPIINFKIGEKSGIHEWSVLAEFKFHDKKKRKYYFEILLGDSFYKSIQKDYTLIELEIVLSLSQIALNLYLYLTTQSPSKLSKYPKDFGDLKIAIGITGKHITQARKTFEKTWGDIKSRGLLKGYRHSEIFISKKDNREYIKFVKQRILIS